ncbi:hypothetical protein ACTA71_000820 [Dictyostelium dimigraforme]
MASLIFSLSPILNLSPVGSLKFKRVGVKFLCYQLMVWKSNCVNQCKLKYSQRETNFTTPTTNGSRGSSNIQQKICKQFSKMCPAIKHYVYLQQICYKGPSGARS